MVFPKESCSHACPSTQAVPTVGLRVSHHGVGLPASAGSRCNRWSCRVCDPVQRGARVLTSNCTHTDDVCRLATTSRCSHWEMKQTGKRVPQSLLPPFALSTAEWHFPHQAVKTVLLKRLRPNVRPLRERIYNSQTGLVLSLRVEPSQNLNARAEPLAAERSHMISSISGVRCAMDPLGRGAIHNVFRLLIFQKLLRELIFKSFSLFSLCLFHFSRSFTSSYSLLPLSFFFLSFCFFALLSTSSYSVLPTFCSLLSPPLLPARRSPPPWRGPFDGHEFFPTSNVGFRSGPETFEQFNF